jgi:hypothetical protein
MGDKLTNNGVESSTDVSWKDQVNEPYEFRREGLEALRESIKIATENTGPELQRR